MPPTHPAVITKKHLARVEKERRARLALIIGSVAVLMIVIGVIVYGILQTQVLPPIQPVAVVNGDEIKTKDFQARVRFERNNLVKQYQNIFQTMQSLGDSPDMKKYFQQNLDEIKSQLEPQIMGEKILETMIADKLVRQEAVKRGITVTDEEVDQSIQEEFSFSIDGKVKPTSTNFPTMMPTSTLSSLQKTLVPEATNTASPTLELTSSTATSTLIPSSTPVPSITPTPTAYTLDKYKRDYQLVVETYKKDIGFDEEELRELVRGELYRTKMNDELTKDVPLGQEMVWARHILVKDEKTAINVLKQLQESGDWMNIAKKESNDPGSKENGGDLGWFGKGAMAQGFEDVVFKLKVGEISNPVQTTFGWHIIQSLGQEIKSLSSSEYQQLRQKEFLKILEKMRKEEKVQIFDYWKERVPTTPALPEGL